MIGERETAETAIPRQERIRGHRIFVPMHSTNEEGVHSAVQAQEEEFGGDLAAVTQECNWVEQRKPQEENGTSCRSKRKEASSSQRSNKQ